MCDGHMTLFAKRKGTGQTAHEWKLQNWLFSTCTWRPFYLAQILKATPANMQISSLSEDRETEY